MSHSKITKNMLINAAILGMFAIIGTAVVAFTFQTTHLRVDENKRNYTLKQLHQLIHPEQHNNDLDRDILLVKDSLLSADQSMKIYRARKDGKPVAAIIECIAPDGYSGKVRLLVAVMHDGTLAGVRATEHMETPGLGDAIDTQKSDWILQFNHKSLHNPDLKNWKVKRDGGAFDQITSATITSRAVVKATRNALEYFKQHKDEIFKPAS